VGETFAVIVHGEATEFDVRATEHRGFLDYLHEIYPDWEEWYSEDTPPYAVIEAARMYAYAFEPKVIAELTATGR
jgi:hypothetical protein